MKLIVLALGVFAAWDVVKIYLPDWLWQIIPPLLVAALATGDYFAPRYVQLIAAVLGVVGLINIIRTRLEREIIIAPRR